MLYIEHLTKTFGEKKAVDDLSLHIAPGEIYGFIGHNGAGKTTTLKSVVGIQQFDSGRITIGGHSIQDDPIACKKMLAYIPDNPDLYEFMTGIQYLNFIADIFGVEESARQERIRKYADLFELTGDLAQPVAAYSHGMKQKLAIISAWLHEPKLILMDEPFVGLARCATRAARSSSRPMCSRWPKNSATRSPSSRAASSSAPARWRRSRATTRSRRSSLSWRANHAENARQEAADGNFPQLLL